jgi:N-formylglutamate deformylase
MSEIHCDFKVDYKKLKIFDENQITDIKYPVILSIPHAGTVFPDEFLNYTSRTIEELRSNEDLFVSDLIEPLMSEGIQVLSMNIARAFIDINRDKIELDDTMFYNAPKSSDVNSRRCRVGLGVLHRVVYQNKNIYDGLLNYEEAMDRIKNVYEPYHKRLKQLVDKCVRKFGFCLLVDCHSMPSMICNIMNENKALDFCVCNLFGESCPDEISGKIYDELQKNDYRVEYNRPYAGAFITFNYCQPRKKIYTLQLEINRAIYMDEQSRQKNKQFQSVASHVSDSLVSLGHFLLDLKK